MGIAIGVLSLKGGVGKTSVVSALGDALSEFGRKVLLVDGNFSAPNLGMHLNIIDPQVTLHHVLAGKANAHKAIYKLDNFDVMPSSNYGMRVNPLKLPNRVKTLKRKYDVVLLDSSPALNEETLGVMLASDGLLAVATPDYPTLKITARAIKMARRRGTPILGLVLNKVHGKDFEMPIGDIEEMAEVPVMAVIPYDLDILESVAEFTPSTRYKPNSKASIEYKKLAATLIGEKYKPKRFKDRINKRRPKRHEINREIYYEKVFG